MSTIPLIDQTALILYCSNNNFLNQVETSYREQIKSLELLHLHEQQKKMNELSNLNPHCVMTRIITRSINDEMNNRQEKMQQMQEEFKTLG